MRVVISCVLSHGGKVSIIIPRERKYHPAEEVLVMDICTAIEREYFLERNYVDGIQERVFEPLQE